MREFKYGYHDSTNKPVTILNFNEKKSLTGTASQKWCLFRLLPFMIGDFVPEGTPIWKLYLTCREVADIVFAPVIAKGWLPHLKQVTVELNEMYAEVSKTFPAKFHFITHYHRLIQEYGSLRNFWCLRFEAKHQTLKKIATHSRNYINIEKTIGDRHQYLQCYDLINFSNLKEGTKTKCNKIAVSDLPNEHLISLQTHCDFNEIENVWSCRSVTMGHITYVVNSIIVLETDFDLDVPIFGQIHQIIYNSYKYFVICKLLKTRIFKEHLHAYEVEFTNSVYSFTFHNQPLDFQHLDLYEFRGKRYVTLKYRSHSRV